MKYWKESARVLGIIDETYFFVFLNFSSFLPPLFGAAGGRGGRWDGGEESGGGSGGGKS